MGGIANRSGPDLSFQKNALRTEGPADVRLGLSDAIGIVRLRLFGEPMGS